MMVCRILDSVFVASSQSVSGREAAPEEVSTTILYRILGSLLLTPHGLFLGERICQRNYLKPWCVVFWALLLLSPHHRFPGERVHQRRYLQP